MFNKRKFLKKKMSALLFDNQFFPKKCLMTYFPRLRENYEKKI